MSTSAQNGQNALRSVRSHRSQIDDADRAVLMDTLVSDGIRSRESVWDPGTAGYSCTLKGKGVAAWACHVYQ